MHVVVVHCAFPPQSQTRDRPTGWSADVAKLTTATAAVSFTGREKLFARKTRTDAGGGAACATRIETTVILNCENKKIIYIYNII